LGLKVIPISEEKKALYDTGTERTPKKPLKKKTKKVGREIRRRTKTISSDWGNFRRIQETQRKERIPKGKRKAPGKRQREGGLEKTMIVRFPYQKERP